MKRLAALVSMWVMLAVLTAYGQQPAPTIGSRAPESKSAAQPATSQDNPETKVWVNTNSGIYHCPGTRWYGTTKAGVYMKQAEAQSKGYRPAYHRGCK